MGEQASVALSTGFGVIVPQASFCWKHEFDNDQRTGYCQLSAMRSNGDAFATSWRHALCARDLLPNLKRLSTQPTIMDRLYQVAANTKEILRESVPREKTLGLSRRGDPPPGTLPLSRGLG